MKTIFRVPALIALLAGALGQPALADVGDDSELATGYVQVKHIDGVWWFISPEGERFISMGVNRVEPHLWLAPYNKQATLDRYGADMVDKEGFFDTDSAAARKWVDRQLATCKDLNFNTLGRHTHPAIEGKLYQDRIYYLASLQTGPLAGWRERNGEGPRPDVFSVDFHNFLEERVKTMCAAHKGSRYLLGYLYTDVPSWESRDPDRPAMKYPWVNAILPLGEASPGKWTWVKHLQSRYDTPEEVARVWGLPVSPTYGISWYHMTRLNTWFDPVDVRRADADMNSFMYKIADRWYRLHYELIRKHDPNHLIMGDKNWITWHFDYVLEALAKYVDVVSIQAYGRWSEDRVTVDKIFAAVGKPIFNGDGCHSFVNEHQHEYGIKGSRTGAKNLAEVAALYQETVEEMMATPYVIGWHHCGFMEQWDPSERGDSPMNENGFMDPFENYHTEWTDVIREVNSKAAKLHEAASNVTQDESPRRCRKVERRDFVQLASDHRTCCSMITERQGRSQTELPLGRRWSAPVGR